MNVVNETRDERLKVLADKLEDLLTGAGDVAGVIILHGYNEAEVIVHLTPGDGALELKEGEQTYKIIFPEEASLTEKNERLFRTILGLQSIKDIAARVSLDLSAIASNIQKAVKPPPSSGLYKQGES